MSTLTPMQVLQRDFLKTFSFFKDIPSQDLLPLMERLKERRFEAREVVFKEGDPGSSCFFIIYGMVNVVKMLPNSVRKYELLATLSEGHIFGQLSLIDRQPRSATCVAPINTLLLELDKKDLDALFAEKAPLAFHFKDYLAQIAVRQLRQANEKLANLVRVARKKGAPLPTQQLSAIVKDTMRSAEGAGASLDEARPAAPAARPRAATMAKPFPAPAAVGGGQEGRSREQVVEAIRSLAASAPAPTAEGGATRERLDLSKFGISVDASGKLSKK